MAIEIGLKNRKEVIVTEELTAYASDHSLPAVFATPQLVSLMELTCADSLKPFLKEEEGSVGVTVNITHSGATPIGQKIYCESELVEISGKRSNKLLFKVNAYDESGLVGSGTHGRAIINMKAFIESLK